MVHIRRRSDGGYGQRCPYLSHYQDSYYDGRRVKYDRYQPPGGGDGGDSESRRLSYGGRSGVHGDAFNLYGGPITVVGVGVAVEGAPESGTAGGVVRGREKGARP